MNYLEIEKVIGREILDSGGRGAGRVSSGRDRLRYFAQQLRALRQRMCFWRAPVQLFGQGPGAAAG